MFEWAYLDSDGNELGRSSLGSADSMDGPRDAADFLRIVQTLHLRKDGAEIVIVDDVLYTRHVEGSASDLPDSRGGPSPT